MNIKGNIANRTVAFLDILGFKQMTIEMTIESLAIKYDKAVNIIDSFNTPSYLLEDKNFPFLNPPWCKKYIFSDSIILISMDDTVLSALKLLIYAWKLSQLLIGYKMPLRGAVTYGEIYLNESKNIILGKPLTRAYELEREQQWIGVIIDNNVERFLPELFKIIKEIPILNEVFLRYKVPLKNKNDKFYYTLNWRWNIVVKYGTRSLFSTSDDPNISLKVNNTLKYAKYVVSRGKLYPQNQDQFPIVFRTLWIGDQEPPYPHGDDL